MLLKKLFYSLGITNSVPTIKVLVLPGTLKALGLAARIFLQLAELPVVFLAMEERVSPFLTV